MGIIAKNILALLGSQVATWIMTLLMLIVIPQYLGDEQFGQLSVAGSLVAFFGLFAALGAGQFIVKQVARDSTRVGPYVFNALVMTVVLAIPLSGAAVGTAYLLGYSAGTIGIVAVACGGMTLTVVNGALVAGLQGQQRMQRAALWAVVDRYISGAFVLVALAARRGLLWVALAAYLYGWASLLGNGAQLFRQVREGAHLNLRLWKVLAVGGALRALERRIDGLWQHRHSHALENGGRCRRRLVHPGVPSGRDTCLPGLYCGDRDVPTAISLRRECIAVICHPCEPRSASDLLRDCSDGRGHCPDGE